MGGRRPEFVEAWEFWSPRTHAREDPQGKFLAYTVMDELNAPEAAVVRESATGQERTLAASLLWGHWSKDSELILGAIDGAPMQVAVCPASGADCKVLTEGFKPVWSADNSRIYFLRPSQIPDSAELWSMSAHGTDEKQITALGPFGSPEMIHFDVSSQDRIGWVQFLPGKQELWLADMP